MQIADEMAVSIHFKLTNPEGELLDSSEGDEPLEYIHGAGFIVPGLEQALQGKSAGDRVKVVVAPEDGYGERDEEKLQSVPREAFDADANIEPGMQFQAESDEGDVLVTVKQVDGDTVLIDANHPLAGLTLHFDVQVVSVRKCTEEELEHGHIHGPNGHHH
jgi:FKBP-type peptidyl-prolyl cis-trans isomerase SlyD